MHLKPNEKLSHFKYCEIVYPEDKRIEFEFKGNEYLLDFSDSRVGENAGYLVQRNTNEPIDSALLLWLSLYFGEDALDPEAEEDNRFTHTRGDFVLKTDQFHKFIQKVEKFPLKSHAKWKQDLVENALSYYSCALRSSVNLMPLNIGFFAMVLECLGNAYYGKRDKYFTLGDKHFKNIIKTRLKMYKKSTNFKQSTRDFEKYIDKEIEVIHLIRNAFYGHSLLHLKKDRDELVAVLREWYCRNGHSKKFANISFHPRRIDDDIQREAFGLYKVGLKLSRLLFFYFIGYSRHVPFATHDFSTIGKSRENYVVKLKPRKA